MTRIVVATGNAGKLREIDAIAGYALRRLGVTLVRPADIGATGWQVDEDRSTFSENAILKAAACARATGLPALADDSGLCVDALGGEPGVHSARWLGPGADDHDRNQALLARFDGLEAGGHSRSARFVCAAALVVPDGTALVREAACHGTIAGALRGPGGFGYDPIFIPEGDTRTFAEMPIQQKNRVSHRTIAFRSLVGMKDFNEMFAGGVIIVAGSPV